MNTLFINYNVRKATKCIQRSLFNLKAWKIPPLDTIKLNVDAGM